MDKGQLGRWSKGELELIKNTFGGDGEEVLFQIRNVLLQLSEEVPVLSSEVLNILKKMLLPELNIDLPLGLQADVRNVLASTPQTAGIKDVHPEVANMLIKANDLVIAYLQERFYVLAGNKIKDEMKLVDLKAVGVKSDEERLVSMIAYLFLINSYIDGGLVALKTLANQKELTEDEKKKKAKENSTK